MRNAPTGTEGNGDQPPRRRGAEKRERRGSSLRLGVSAVIALAGLASLGSVAAAEKQPADNSLCYVCHLTLQNDEITAKHQVQGIGCVKCHGTSSEHMHDEMLMTKPDLLHGRKEVVSMCSQCHDKPHDAKPQQHQAFLEKWRGHDRPNGRVVTDGSICTDCHGTHILAKRTISVEAKGTAWKALFNGRDLAGWKSTPADGWHVVRGRLAAAPRTAADLWSDAAYADFRLSVTFRAEGTVRAAIALRGQPATPSPRVEMLTDPQVPARAGSVFVPGKGWALANLRGDLLDEEGWNTVTVEYRGPRVAVSLNGEEIGSVTIAGASEGRIGLHVEQRPASAATFTVREIQIQKLSPTAGAARP
jgi:hypothetical protein